MKKRRPWDGLVSERGLDALRVLQGGAHLLVVWHTSFLLLLRS